MIQKNRSAALGTFFSCFVLATTLTLFPSQPASALTGADVVDKMAKEERGGYLAGAVEMASFLSHVDGRTERSGCIMDWYYNKDGVEQIVTTLSRYKDRQVQPVVYALIERACGK